MTLVETFKKFMEGVTAVKAITGVVTAAIAITGAVITFDSRYAHSESISKILSNQETTLKTIQKQQKQHVLFQLDYYDEQIRRIEESERVLQTRTNKTQSDIDALKRLQLQREDMKARKAYATKSLIE